MIRWLTSNAILKSAFILSVALFVLQGIAFANTIDNVRHTIYSWADAWKSRDIIRYMSFYSPTFQAKELDYQRWLNKRAKQFQTLANIEVNISDLWVFIEGKEATARFVQHYQDAGTTDVGEKTLRLINENKKWLIISEEWMPLKASVPGTEKPAASNRQMLDMVHHTTDKSSQKQEESRSRSIGITVKNINFHSENNTEKVCLNLNPFTVPVVFTLEDKTPRIVIDIKDVYDWKGRSTTPINGRLIKRIRTHLHRYIHKLRIVLDLNPAEDYIIDQSYGPKEGTYCVEVK